MPKKIVALADYISASDAAMILREKLRRPISNKYIRKLSERKRTPVRTQPMGNRLLYNREDIEATTIRERNAS